MSEEADQTVNSEDKNEHRRVSPVVGTRLACSPPGDGPWRFDVASHVPLLTSLHRRRHHWATSPPSQEGLPSFSLLCYLIPLDTEPVHQFVSLAVDPAIRKEFVEGVRSFQEAPATCVQLWFCGESWPLRHKVLYHQPLRHKVLHRRLLRHQDHCCRPPRHKVLFRSRHLHQLLLHLHHKHLPPQHKV